MAQIGSQPGPPRDYGEIVPSYRPCLPKSQVAEQPRPPKMRSRSICRAGFWVARCCSATWVYRRHRHNSQTGPPRVAAIAPTADYEKLSLACSAMKLRIESTDGLGNDNILFPATLSTDSLSHATRGRCLASATHNQNQLNRVGTIPYSRRNWTSRSLRPMDGHAS